MALLSGYIKQALIVLIIVLVHELGHVFFIKCFGYEISEISFYPFGGITRVNKLINSPINKEILIVLGGIINQLILGIIFGYGYNLGLINTNTYLIFKDYNKTILLFNMLPIIPLDGSILIRLVLEKFISYKKSYYCYLIISLVSVIIFFIMGRKLLLNNLIIVFLLIYKVYESLKNYKFIYEKFLLERYLYDLHYKKIINCKCIDISRMGKEKYYFFKNGKSVVSEKKLLTKLFDRSE